MKNKETLFRELLEQHDSRIRSICRYYARDKSFQDDLYQEVVMHIWKSMDSFRGDAQWGTWIYRVAMNTVMGAAGKELHHRKIYMTQSSPDLVLQFVDEPPQAIYPEEMHQWLEAEINQLNIIDRALVVLFLEGVGGKEIASVVGLTEPNVRVKLHRIKEQLAKVLTVKMQKYGN
ncbi:MAG: RNA polymerase sigma factor [Bacteroidota bacterium]